MSLGLNWHVFAMADLLLFVFWSALIFCHTERFKRYAHRITNRKT